MSRQFPFVTRNQQQDKKTNQMGKVLKKTERANHCLVVSRHEQGESLEKIELRK